MITRRAVALTPFALALCACLSQRAASADAGGGDITLPLDLSGPRPTVSVTLPGQEPETWVFDTGAAGSIIAIDRAQALQLPNNGVARVGSPIGGTQVEGFITTISGARIGEAPLPNFTAVAMPLPHGMGHLGVLSPNVFRGRLLVFDFGRSQVRITDRAQAPASAPTPYSGGHPLPAMTVTIAGASHEAHLDTGAPHLVSFPYALAESLPLAAPPQQVGVARFVDGERPRYTARIQGPVNIGPLTVENPEVSLIDGLPFVNVGTMALRQMVVTLDPERRVSWAALA